jgi:hypothetical protein
VQLAPYDLLTDIWKWDCRGASWYNNTFKNCSSLQILGIPNFEIRQGEIDGPGESSLSSVGLTVTGVSL